MGAGNDRRVVVVVILLDWITLLACQFDANSCLRVMLQEICLSQSMFDSVSEYQLFETPRQVLFSCRSLIDKDAYDLIQIQLCLSRRCSQAFGKRAFVIRTNENMLMNSISFGAE